MDGFRFDLASCLCRDGRGRPLADPPLIRAISKDPVLSQVKLIAEPWDIGMYQVGGGAAGRGGGAGQGRAGTGAGQGGDARRGGAGAGSGAGRGGAHPCLVEPRRAFSAGCLASGVGRALLHLPWAAG